MRIAICDDDLQLCDSLKNNIYEYANNHNLEPVIDIFNSGEELIVAKIKYDIIILDYQMDGLNGIETARILRNGINSLACIIFLTSFPQIAISAYEVDTYRFVVKSTLYEGLFKALDDYRKTIALEKKVRIKSDHSILVIPTEEIIFFESMNKLVIIHLSDGTIVKTRCTLSELYNTVPHTSFVKIHKSFVINFKYITEETENGIKLCGVNYELPLSRRFAKLFRNNFANYLKDCI